jgi:hypothetical protein
MGGIMVGFLDRYRLNKTEEFTEEHIDEVVDLLKKYSEREYIPEGLIDVSREIVEGNPRLGISLYTKILAHPKILDYFKKVRASQDTEPATDDEKGELVELKTAVEHEFLTATPITKTDLMFR